MIQTIGCKGIVTTIGLLFLFIGNGAVAEDSLVAAAEKFAETAIKHGRDTYGKDHTPVFVDVLDDQNMNPELLESAITKKTKAIMPVHLTGRISEMFEIMKIANKYNIPVIEDAAQSI